MDWDYYPYEKCIARPAHCINDSQGLHSNQLSEGKECGSVLSSRLWEGTLRDDTKTAVCDYSAYRVSA